MAWTQRLKEPSTYAGLAALGSLFRINELAAFGAPEVAIALAGLAAVFMPESKPEKAQGAEQAK